MHRRSISPKPAPTAVRTVGSPAYFLGRPAEVWLAAIRRRSPAAFRERE
jgi:hypothetical protein